MFAKKLKQLQKTCFCGLNWRKNTQNIKDTFFDKSFAPQANF